MRINIFDMVMCLSSAVELISPTVFNHNKRVGYIAARIAKEMGFSHNKQMELIIAGSLHDIGAISITELANTLEFDFETNNRHAEIGYWYLKSFQPFKDLAPIVRFHHVPWAYGYGSRMYDYEIPIGSQIINLADRVEVSIDKNIDVISQSQAICTLITKDSDSIYHPDVVAGFLEVAKKECFWFNLGLQSLVPVLKKMTEDTNLDLDLEGLEAFAELFSRIIDFRSRFTSIHSRGVACTAMEMANIFGLSEVQAKMIRIAGLLHDLGKIVVPTEILEKPGKLTTPEFNIVKSHSFYTYRILDDISELKEIKSWAAFHHERLDGNGYPFHYQDKELSLESRLMAVSDVFTAITEDRPYRIGMNQDKALTVLTNMVKDRALDGQVVEALQDNYNLINNIRLHKQKDANQEYLDFLKDLGNLKL